MICGRYCGFKIWTCTTGRTGQSNSDKFISPGAEFDREIVTHH